MIIKLYSNRKVEPSSIIMANQHENMTRVLEFNLEQVPNGYRYLVLTNSSGSNLYLITDNKVDITSAFTWNGQTYEANVVVSNIELENELVSTNVLWISNTFRLQVRRNNINAEELSKLPIPPDLQMPYDKLLHLIEDVEGKLENGEFNGKDGVGIKSIEKTGSEGLVDTYTITLTDDSTFVYTVTNGRDGIDGKSAYELAVENGFEGTEEEWLESLRYDHSDEFKKLAEQVKQDAQSSADNATKAENAMNKANTTAQENVKAINQASTNAQNAITTAKDDAIEEIENTGVPLEGIEKLAIKETTTGDPTIISDSTDWRLQQLLVYGQSEQVSTTGAQLINDYREGVNNGVTWKIEGSFVSFNGTIKDDSPNRILITGIPFKQETNKTYYVKSFNSALSVDITVIKNDGSSIYVQQYTIDGTEKEIYVSCMVNNTNNQAGLKVDITGYIALTENSAMSEWEPYTGGKPSPSPDYPQEIISKEVSEIKVTGANLIKYPYYQNTQTVKGVTFTVNDDQSITINGTNDGTGNSRFRITSNDRFKKDDSISIGLISDKDDENVWVNAFYVGEIGINEKIENRIVSDEEKSYDLVITVASGATIDNVTIKVMRNYGAKLLPYEPYKSQTITLSEPITLRGIPVDNGGNVTIDGQQYVSDVITEKDGVIGVDRNAKQLLFDGSEDEVVSVGEYLGNVTRTMIMIENSSYNVTFSDKFKFINNYDLDEPHFYYWNNVLHLFVPVQLTSSQKFREWLQTNPVGIVYTLETPTFEPLPEEVQAQYKALKSYYPNTVIQTGCWNEVEYVADTKTWIENKLNGVTELALGIGGK